MHRFGIMCVAVCCFLFPAHSIAAEHAQQIVISEDAEAKVAPTSGVLNFSQSISIMLRQQDGTTLSVADAKKMLLEETQKMTASVKESLVFAKDFTKDFDANVSFSPVYDRDSKINKIVGYQAHTRYSVTVTVLDKAGNVTSALLNSGIEQVSPLYSVVDDAGRLDCEKRALQIAVKRAKERAAVMAELMDGKIERLSKAVINSSGMPRMMMAKGMAESASSMYEPADTTCNVRVEVVFDVD